MKDLRGKLPAFIFGLFLFLFLICLLEGIFFALNSFKSSRAPRVTNSARGTASLFCRDRSVSYKLNPNNKITETCCAGEEKIYAASYSTDEFGRRLVPCANAQKREDFLLFFGCSFVFGQGVNDDETLPFYLAQLATYYRPYNYGVPGYGPQHMLAKLQSGEVRKEVTEKKGLAFYVFMDSQVMRAIGSRHSVSQKMPSYPYYYLNASGGLVRQGDFYTGRPFLTAVYGILTKSQVVRYFNIEFPPRITEGHIKLVSAIVAESARIFKEEFKDGDFYVIIFPGSEKSGKMLIKYLDRAGIKYLDYSDITIPNQSGKAFPAFDYDGHPRPESYKYLAEKISGDMAELKE